MKTLRSLLLPVFLIALGSACHSQNEKNSILKNVNVINIFTGQIEIKSILIERGIIKEIKDFENLTKTLSTLIIDCHDKYAIPGLIDMPSHIFEEENSLKYLDALLRIGITGIRDMGGKADSIALIKDKIISGKLSGPNIYFSGYTLDGEKTGDPHHYVVNDTSEISEVFKELKGLHADFVKVHNFYPQSLFQFTVDKAQAEGLPIVGHIPAGVSLDSAIVSLHTIEHITSILRALIFDTSNEINDLMKAFEKLNEIYVDSLSNKFNENKTAFTPTLYTIKKAYEESTNPVEIVMGQRMMVNFMAITKMMADNNVLILAGSDVVPINDENLLSLHYEMELLSRSGISNLGVLQAATINPAKSLNISHNYGSLETDKVADILILNQNPLEDISHTQNIYLVFKNGVQINSISNDIYN